MVHINCLRNTKIKDMTLKQLKAVKDNEFIDKKLYYYLKPKN